MRTVLPLTGVRSVHALNAFNALMLGLKMLPAYMGESYEDFMDRVEAMEDADRIRMIRQAAQFVRLEKDELESLLCFYPDPNGVPYSAENLKGLGPADLVEGVVAVCAAIGRIKLTLITEAEKKNLKSSPSTSGLPSLGILD